MISDDDIVKVKRDTLQVGIIQRTDTRVITNMDDIIDMLMKNLPHDTNLTITTNMPYAIEEQAAWFATKDVIIAAHGAALMNCIFILPQTIVMQLYPVGYFWQSLESAIELPGGIALDTYSGRRVDVELPMFNWLEKKVKKDWNDQNVARDSNITVEPSNVVYPILNVMGLLA
jgi:hypothetical protein